MFYLINYRITKKGSRGGQSCQRSWKQSSKSKSCRESRRWRWNRGRWWRSLWYKEYEIKAKPSVAMGKPWSWKWGWGLDWWKNRAGQNWCAQIGHYQGAQEKCNGTSWKWRYHHHESKDTQEETTCHGKVNVMSWYTLMLVTDSLTNFLNAFCQRSGPLFCIG